jgi:hypothetical protein
MELISTTTVGTAGATTIEFTNINPTGTDLIIYLSARTNQAGYTNFNVRFNNLTTNYSAASMIFTPTATLATANTLTSSAIAQGTAQTADAFTAIEIYIPNFASSREKPISIIGTGENYSATSSHAVNFGNRAGTAATTSVQIIASAGSFVQNTTASLYRVIKGSGGATVS